jgi:hypothetical protein
MVIIYNNNNCGRDEGTQKEFLRTESESWSKVKGARSVD